VISSSSLREPLLISIAWNKPCENTKPRLTWLVLNRLRPSTGRRAPGRTTPRREPCPAGRVREAGSAAASRCQVAIADSAATAVT
jgi:hypothetical protein